MESHQRLRFTKIMLEIVVMSPLSETEGSSRGNDRHSWVSSVSKTMKVDDWLQQGCVYSKEQWRAGEGLEDDL